MGLLLACTGAAEAASFRIYGTVAITNLPTFGQTLTVNSDARMWQTNTTATRVTTNTTTATSTTNLLVALASYPFAGASASYASSTSVVLIATLNSNLTITMDSNWASITYSTNVVYDQTPVVVPPSVVTNLANQTNIVSGLAAWLSQNTVTNKLTSSAPAFVEFVRTNADQTIWGTKTLAAFAGTAGSITNPTLVHGTIQGTVTTLTNGYWTNGVLDDPVMTNALVRGGFQSVGSGSLSTLIGSLGTASGNQAMSIGYAAAATLDNAIGLGVLAYATGTNTLAIGNAASATTNEAIAIGRTAYSWGSNSLALGSYSAATNANAVAIGHYVNTTAADQFILGNAAHRVTIPGELTAAYQSNSIFSGTNRVTGQWQWAATAYGSAANGPNTITNPGTVLVKVSGPTAVWSLDGISGGYAGKHYVLWNASGYTMTVNNESGLAAAADRVLTLVGSSVAIGTNGMALVYYDGASSRWVLGPNTRQNVLFSSSAVTGVGTDYSVTGTPALVDFGTTDPSVSIPEAGTYQVTYHVSYLPGASAADVFGWKVRNASNNTDVDGSYIRQVNLVANQQQDATGICFFTATNACTLQLWGVNATAARGTVLSTNTYLNYLRVN